ncbi:tyrosine-type recombinase/integrase, partial [Saccharomonospora saliphila]|uniref:tyrosine-type recombinase/integrase n=1 Tax=Saccharomonospora saliphila TaxID=369829 RepID=UPI00036C2690
MIDRPHASPTRPGPVPAARTSPEPATLAPTGPTTPEVTALTAAPHGAAVAEAVELLPALPPADPADRYSVRHVTVLWLSVDYSAHTRRAYYADLAAWLSFCHRTGLDPLRARRADVDAFKATLTVTGHDGTTRPAAPSTVARTLAGISSWYRYLQSNDVADRNPVDAVTRPQRDKASPLPALDEHSTATLLDHAETRARRLDTEGAWRDAALVSLLFHTGLRVSGLTGATVADLGTDSGYTILRYTGKGGRRDLVPVVAPALRPLARYLALRGDRLGIPPERLDGPLLATCP